MDFNWWMIIVIFMLIVILVVLYDPRKRPKWLHKKYWSAYYFENPWKIYSRTGGSLDEEARLAMRRSLERGRPADHLLVATVLTQNLLFQENQPYYIPNRKRAITQAQTRHQVFNRAREQYMQALQTLEPNITRVPEPSRINIEPDEPGNMFIVDTATNFAYEGGNLLRAYDPTPNAEEDLIMVDINVPELEPPIIDQNLALLAQRQRQNIIRSRQEVSGIITNSINPPKSNGITSSTYLDLATQNTNDPQNSHDTGVNMCLKGIMQRLRKDQEGVNLPSMDEIEKDISEKGIHFSENRPQLQKDALSVVGRLRNGEKALAIDSTDGEVLRRLWARTHDPKNAKVKNKMQQAIFDSLIDSWEEGITDRKIVCVNGRISRMLGSLALLDHDSRNWEVKKLEQFKNDIFEKTRELIQSESRKALISENAEIQLVARSYLAETQEELASLPTDIPETEATKNFTKYLHSAIEKMVDEYATTVSSELGIGGGLPPHMLQGVKEEAKASVI